MLSFREAKHAFWLLLLIGVGLVVVLVPLPQVLPTYFDAMVPDFLQNKSLLMYLHEHANFLIELFTSAALGLFIVILYLWRKR